MAIAVYLLDAMFSIYLGVLRAVFVMPMWRKLEISSISLLFLSLCLFFFEFRRRKSEAQAVMYLGRGDYDSYQIARNDLEDSGWLSPEIEINSLDKIPLGEYLQAGISKMKSTDWA